MNADSDRSFLATKEHKGHKEIFSAITGCGKTLTAVVASRKALRQRFLAQPDGLHGLGRVLRSSTVFRQPSASIRVHLRLKK
jgi:hypothetical protein